MYSGLTILQTLLQEGIHVPHLCYDIRLERSNGNCGLCVVEIHDSAETREVKACHTPVQENMVIVTNSPNLEHYRKIRLEQVLFDHNADCVAPCVMTCPANIDIQSYLSVACFPALNQLFLLNISVRMKYCRLTRTMFPLK